MKLIIFLLLSGFSGVAPTTYCNMCSDSNIETHFGVFFTNPRDLQEGYRQNVHGCNSTSVTKQECESTCFSLNVTSLHIKSRQLIPFGVSYGCSSQLLPNDMRKRPNCVRKDIVLRTIPPYVVQAEYCSCSGDSCNSVSVLPVVKRGAKHFYASRTSRVFSITSVIIPVFCQIYFT